MKTHKLLFLILALAFGIRTAKAIPEPQFPGGKEALATYLAAAMQYPKDADKKLNSKVEVCASFVVERCGHTGEVEVRGTDSEILKREVRHLIENMPLWTPAEIEGTKIRSKASVSLTYDFSSDEAQREQIRPKDYVFRDTMLNDYRRVLRNGKWAFRLKGGYDVLQYRFEHLYYYPDGTIKARINDKFGLQNRNAEEVIPYEYEELYYYEGGYSRVKKNGKWGLISVTGKTLAQCQYDTMGIFGMDASFGDVFSENMLDGKVLMRSLALVSRNGKFGFIDKQGKEVIECVYDKIEPFSIGYAVFTQNGKKGVFTDRGKVVISPIYDDLKFFTQGLAMVKRGNSVGLVDMLGVSVLQCRFDALAPFANSNMILARRGGKYGLYEGFGREAIECKYDAIEANPNARNSILLTKAGKTTEERFFFEASAEISPDLEKTLERYEQRGKWGFRLSDGTIYVSAKYDFADRFSDGLAFVCKGDKWGAISLAGREVVPLKYDSVSWCDGNILRVSINGKIYYIDTNGNETLARNNANCK